MTEPQKKLSETFSARRVQLPRGQPYLLTMANWYWASWDWLVENKKVDPMRSFHVAWEYAENSSHDTHEVFRNTMECHIYAQISHYIEIQEGLANSNRRAWDPRNYRMTTSHLRPEQFARYAELFDVDWQGEPV